MSDAGDAQPELGPFIWQVAELPPLSVSGAPTTVRQVNPPTGYMLHSWAVSPANHLVIAWVRMPRDPASGLAAKLWEMTQPKGSEG